MYPENINGFPCIQCRRLGKYVSQNASVTSPGHAPYVVLCSQFCYSKYWGIGEELSPDLLEHKPGVINIPKLKTTTRPVKSTTGSGRKQKTISSKRPSEWASDQLPAGTEVVVTVGPPGINLISGQFSRETMGRVGWTCLSMFAQAYPNIPTVEEQQNMKMFLEGFARSYPCEICREHFLILYKESPPIVTSRVSLLSTISHWHNTVNSRLGKPLFPLVIAIESDFQSGHYHSKACKE